MRAVYTIALIASVVMMAQFAITRAAVADCLNIVNLPSKLITAETPNCVVRRGSLCQDRVHQVEVTNTCQHKIRIYVGKGDSKGEWHLEPGNLPRKFACEELHDQCKEVPISLLDGTTTTETTPHDSKPKSKPDPNQQTKPTSAPSKVSKDKDEETDANDLPNWCKDMIRRCDEWLAAAQTLEIPSPQTKSQCENHCRLMRIEKCNRSSPTFKDSERTCSTAMNRDIEESNRTYAALAAGRHAIYVGTAWARRRNQSEADAVALQECSKQILGASCQIVRRFSRGACGYIAQGHKPGGTCWGADSSPAKAYSECTAQGCACKPAMGTCTQ